MTTTTLIAEILIAGLLATVWIMILVTTICGRAPITWFMKAIDQQKGALVPLFLAVAYVLGVVMDRGSDTFFDNVGEQLNLKFHEPEDARDAAIIVYVRGNEQTVRFLEYLRGRVRVSRTAFVNLTLIVLTTLALVRSGKLTVTEISNAKRISIIVIVIAALAAFTWWRTSWSYYERLRQAHRLLQHPTTTAVTSPS